jgi:hypothetical protein
MWSPSNGLQTDYLVSESTVDCPRGIEDFHHDCGTQLRSMSTRMLVGHSTLIIYDSSTRAPAALTSAPELTT